MELKEIVATIAPVEEYSLYQNEVGIVVAIDDVRVDVCFPRLDKTFSLNKKQVRSIEIVEYGDHATYKCCNVCHRILSVDMFDKNQTGKDNRTVRRPSCKDCRELIDGVSMSAAEKRKWEPTKPHLSAFTCPVCEKTTIPGFNSKIVLNHDHATGVATGWICDSCNTGLGPARYLLDTFG